MEYQAVIFAGGKGSRYPELCSERTKAMLPIGTLPMILYPLHLLESADFKEVIIVTQEESVEEISNLPETHGIKIKLIVIGIDPEYSEDWGTADALRHVADRIKTDVILLSCDTVSDISLKKVVHAHRVYGAALTAVLSPTYSDIINVSVPGKKKKQQLEIDFVGMSKSKLSNNRLLFLSAGADFEETLDVRMSLLNKFPHVQVQSDLMDAHLYVFSNWMIKYLAVEKSFRSIKGEFIPHVLKKQTEVKIPKTKIENKPNILSFAARGEMDELIRNKSMYDDGLEDDPLSCYSFITNGSFCLRANSLATYMESNRKILQYWPFVDQSIPRVHPTAQINSKQVQNDCIIGPEVKISDKVSIKNCIIGDHCVIQGKVQLVNCVLMSHVTIGEGCKVSGSILCDNSTLENNVEVKDCIIGSKKTASKSYTNEVVSDVGSWTI